ncbi:hypothetical protein [Psychrobacter sp.]|uniref:hypothetical protein n=1 Tax=Psychrobacter sp. TaxID=56811 RepID=UPI003563AB0B
MNNLQPLKWQKGAALDTFETVHELVHYTIRPDIDDPNKYRANLGNGDHKTLNSVDEAKQWIETDYYPHKMQPYVKPLPTWIDASKQLPKEDGEYLALIKGFTYEMGNLDDLQPRIGKWNGGRGCFNEDYGNVLFVAWMPIPEFSEVTK